LNSSIEGGSMPSQSSLTLQIDTCPTYEFLMSLCVWNDTVDHATYEDGQQWFQAVRQQASPGLLSAVEEFCQKNDCMWVHLLSVAYDSAHLHEVLPFIEHVAAMDALEIRLRLTGYYQRYFRRATAPEIMYAAATGDLQAQQEFLRTSYPEDASWQAMLWHLFTLSLVDTRKQLVELLRGWYEEVFQPREAEWLPILARDAEARRLLASTVSVERCIEVVTNGWEYIPEPGIRQILLIPSVIIRPQVYSLDYGEVKIFCYPVADEYITDDVEAPPVRLVRLVKALSDERRLRILKRLATGSYTLQQLADYFDVGKTLLHHHLVILRAAGLVHLLGDENKKYRLRRDTLAQLAPLLDGYLLDRLL
jgi:DNA-binding transcriptional ArsR family regulator